MTEGLIVLGLKETQAQAGGEHTHPSRDNTPQLGLLEETRLNGVVMLLMRLSRNKNELSHFFFLVDKENLNCQVRSPEAKGFDVLTSSVTFTGPRSAALHEAPLKAMPAVPLKMVFHSGRWSSLWG